MIGKLEVKVCGLTRVGDAADAASIGADYLGFIFYPKSPRGLDLEDYKAMRPKLPCLPRVAVVVAPDSAQLKALQELGFDYFQIHYSADVSRSLIQEWTEQLTPQKLWLAPKVDPGRGFDEGMLPFADTWMWDTYDKNAYGGTGKVSDWEGFEKISRRFPTKNWVLAGGLNPDNVAAAVAETGTKRIDLNSGVEKSPGAKDLKKLKQVKIALENH